MGFYTTDERAAVLDSHQENLTPPSKNRVWDFLTASETCAGFFESQPVESHWEKLPTPTKPVSGMRFYGYRYFQPETGRWVSRDRVGEHKDHNLYCFVQNNVPLRFDYLGLTTIDDSLEDCKNKTEEWKGLKDGTFHTPFGLTDPWILFYLRFLTCDVSFTCTKCCRGEENGSNQGHVGIFGGRSCNINMCANNIVRTGASMQGVLAHELTHCFQFCNKNSGSGCANCMCNEMQAYRRGDPSLTTEQLIDRAVGSCEHSTPQQCDATQAAAQRVNFINNPAAAVRCSLHGTGP